MQALTFGGIEKVVYQSVSEPQILAPTDVIVRITLSSICGSDLHVYHGEKQELMKIL